MCTGLVERKHGDESLYQLAKAAHKAIAKLPYDDWLSDLMGSADVILCTLCSSASKVMNLARPETIEALIVDEAAAATEPDLYIPFHLRPSRLLVVGDPKQLPSTVLSDRAKMFGLDFSLQERLMNHCNYHYTMLNIQYRMHPEISTFPSRCFYSGKIRDGDNVMAPRTRGRARLLLDNRPYVFLQVDGVEQKGIADSICNEREALAVVNLVKRLEDCNDPAWHSVDRIRIITFYTAQVLLLRKKLSDAGLEHVLVATVDSSQGCEADVVIVSLVRSSSAGFLKDDRRVNVALTRAKHQLVCVGNVSRFSSMFAAYTLNELADDAWKRNAVVNLSCEPAAKRSKTKSSWIP